jgi:hypothetical protein
MALWPLVLFVVGLAHAWPRVRARLRARRASTATPAGSTAPDRIYVRFEHADGTIDHKRLFRHSLRPATRWRSKPFQLDALRSSDERQVYAEVLSRG